MVEITLVILLTWIRIHIHQILWIRIRIQSMRIHVTGICVQLSHLLFCLLRAGSRFERWRIIRWSDPSWFQWVQSVEGMYTEHFISALFAFHSWMTITMYIVQMIKGVINFSPSTNCHFLNYAYCILRCFNNLMSSSLKFSPHC